MHVLKALFRESCVAMAVTPHIASAVDLAISGFTSPLWSIRNAATQLFGKSKRSGSGVELLRDSTKRTRVQILCCGVKILGRFFHSTLLMFTQLYK